MKKLFVFLLILFNLALLSCEKEIVKESILNVPNDSLSFDAEGEDRTVSFVSNDRWKASSNQSWCMVSPASGDATDNNKVELIVSCEPNFSGKERNCTITLSCGSLSRPVQIIQAPILPLTESSDPRFREEMELICLVFRLAGATEYNQCQVPAVSSSADQFFASMKGHEAVSLASECRRKSVSYDAVTAFGNHLYLTKSGKLYFNGLIADGSDTSFDRWTDADRKKMLPLLNDFYQKSNYHQWFQSLESLQREAVRSFQQKTAIDYNWFSRFFGPNENLSFKIGLSFLIGSHNNGISFRLVDGRTMLSPVMGSFRQDEAGHPYYAGDDGTLVHEFCHPYCNPLINKYWSSMKDKAEDVYSVVEEQMKARAYGTAQTMMNETFVRASVIRYYITKGEDAVSIENRIRNEEQIGFMLIRTFVDALDKREQQQADYPTMDAFMPELIKAVNKANVHTGRHEEYTYPAIGNLLPGLFSVSSSQKVRFTKGNLYWNGSSWALESNQMNGPVSWSPTHVGHFYWTTTAEASYAEVYGETPSDADRLFCDGGDDAHSLTVEGLSGLRVLTDGKGGELEYLLKKRPNAQNLFRVPVSIEGVGDCFVIAPDDYTGAIDSAYDPDSWRLAESAGLVCLTPSGFRQKKSLHNNSRGFFWCGTSGAGTQWPNNAYTWCFADQLYHHNLSSRGYGCCIRLVQDVK